MKIHYINYVNDFNTYINMIIETIIPQKNFHILSIIYMKLCNKIHQIKCCARKYLDIINIKITNRDNTNTPYSPLFLYTHSNNLLRYIPKKLGLLCLQSKSLTFLACAITYPFLIGFPSVVTIINNYIYLPICLG